MNKKGFTLVEILLVVVILGIICAITIPNIMDSLNESKIEAGENVEKTLIESLKLYTKNKEDELWCDNTSGYGIDCDGKPKAGTIYVTLEELEENINQDIDMNDCRLNGRMTIRRYESNGKYNYSYEVKIKCKDKSGEYYNSDKQY